MYRCIFVACYGFSLPRRKAIDQRFFDPSKKRGLAHELKLVDDNGFFGRPIAMDAFPCSLKVLEALETFLSNVLLADVSQSLVELASDPYVAFGFLKPH
jgi:hypothetical protein